MENIESNYDAIVIGTESVEAGQQKSLQKKDSEHLF